MNLDEEIARVELVARTLASVFEHHPNQVLGDLARRHIRVAEQKAKLVPREVFDRMTADHVRLTEAAEERVVEAIVQGARPRTAVDEQLAALETVWEQDKAELKGYALRAWEEARDDLLKMQEVL